MNDAPRDTYGTARRVFGSIVRIIGSVTTVIPLIPAYLGGLYVAVIGFDRFGLFGVLLGLLGLGGFAVTVRYGYLFIWHPQHYPVDAAWHRLQSYHRARNRFVVWIVLGIAGSLALAIEAFLLVKSYGYESNNAFLYGIAASMQLGWCFFTMRSLISDLRYVSQKHRRLVGRLAGRQV